MKRKIIKNKSMDVAEIKANHIYINCRFYDETLEENLSLYNNVIIDCHFNKIYKIFCCFNTFIKHIHFTMSWVTIAGSCYISNMKFYNSFCEVIGEEISHERNN